MSARSRRHSDGGARLRFALALLIFVPVMALVFRDGVMGNLLMALRAATAEGTVHLLSGIGIDAARQATAVFHPTGFGIEISRGCTGFVGCALLVVAVSTYPADPRARWIGLLFCPVAFLVVNFLRLTHLFYVGVYHPSLFHVAHAVVWQGVMVITVIALWMGWRVFARR